MYFKQKTIFTENKGKRITGKTIVQVNDKFVIVKSLFGALYGVVSLDGKIILPMEYRRIENKNGRFYAHRMDSHFIEIYDYNGNYKKKKVGSHIRYTNCDRLIVEDGEKREVIDRDGNNVLDKDYYDTLQVISNDRAIVSLSNISLRKTSPKYLIDLNNFKFIMRIPSNAKVEVLDKETLIKYQHNHARIIDCNGKVIKGLGYCKNIYSNKKGYAIIQNKNGFNIINNKGDILELLYCISVDVVDDLFLIKYGTGEKFYVDIEEDNKIVKIAEQGIDNYRLMKKGIVTSNTNDNNIEVLSVDINTSNYCIGKIEKSNVKAIYKKDEETIIKLNNCDEIIPVDDMRIIINNCLFNISDLNSKNVKTQLEVFDDNNHIKYSKVLDNDDDVELYKNIIKTEVYRGIDKSNEIALRKKNAIDYQNEKNQRIIMDNIDYIVKNSKQKIKK